MTEPGLSVRRQNAVQKLPAVAYFRLALSGTAIVRIRRRLPAFKFPKHLAAAMVLATRANASSAAKPIVRPLLVLTMASAIC